MANTMKRNRRVARPTRFNATLLNREYGACRHGVTGDTDMTCGACIVGGSACIVCDIPTGRRSRGAMCAECAADWRDSRNGH